MCLALASLTSFTWLPFIVFCLAHPNGWSTLEQGVLLHALSVGVHTPELDGPGSERVVFVTEGEASVHFGLHYTSAAKTESWLSVCL